MIIRYMVFGFLLALVIGIGLQMKLWNRIPIKTTANLSPDAVRILGLMQEIPETGSGIDGMVKGAMETTTRIVASKTGEIKAQVLAAVQKEVEHLTTSQVHSLKKQVCADWGIISPLPTKQAQ